MRVPFPAVAFNLTYLRVQRDSLAPDLVEPLHPDDVSRNDDDGREESSFVGVARVHAKPGSA